MHEVFIAHLCARARRAVPQQEVEEPGTAGKKKVTTLKYVYDAEMAAVRPTAAPSAPRVDAVAHIASLRPHRIPTAASECGAQLWRGIVRCTGMAPARPRLPVATGSVA
jgi:hypothetical protein